MIIPLLLLVAATLQTPECPAVPGLEPLLVSGNVLLLGEMHGTEQSPRFVAAVACQGLRKGLPVTVGLELPRGQEPAAVAYLASEGTAKDREALLATDFWTRSYQDGRTSQAMLGLIEELRRLSRAGLPVRIRWIDIDAPDPERDRRMAERLAEAVAERPADLFVVLAGNYHTRQAKGAPWNKEFSPMGLHLTQLAPKARVISLDSSYTDGETWACLQTEAAPDGECKVWPMKGKGKPEGPFPRVVLGSGLDANGYSGVYEVGPLSA
ncbi:MAG TPA: hypothetical protein VJ725_13995, partial [Thermoanaerobaculia bacterium]|nr:hypothetical protein [Thermoanaerobaculia bacterium]